MSEELKENVSPESKAAGYEKEDANGRMVIGFTILTVLLIAGMILGLMEFFMTTKEQQYEASVLVPESVTIRELRIEDETILNSYRVLDSSKQVYQIPVSRAMELMAAEAFQSTLPGQKGGASTRGKKP